MQQILIDHFPRLYLWLWDTKDSLQLFSVAMVAARDSAPPVDWLKIIIGVVASAWLSAYATGERTAAELKQYAAMQAEFRQEVRSYMRDHEVKVETLRDRVTRVEMASCPNGMGSMESQAERRRK